LRLPVLENPGRLDPSGVLFFCVPIHTMRTYDKLIATIPLRRSADIVRPGSGRSISRLHISRS